VFQKLTPDSGMTPDYTKFIDSCCRLFNSCHKSRKVQKDIDISKTLWLKITPAPTLVPVKNIHSWSYSDSGWKALTPAGVDSCTPVPAPPAHLAWSGGGVSNRRRPTGVRRRSPGAMRQFYSLFSKKYAFLGIFWPKFLLKSSFF